MKIFADPITVNCRKVLAGFKLMDIDYTLEKVDYFQAEHKEEPYRSLNPNCSLPALKDGDFVLWESNAMLQYAADKAGKDAYYPKDLQTRADINRWLMWEGAQWFPSCYKYLVEYCVKPLLGDAPDEAVIAGEAENFNQLAGILDQRLAGSDWLCGPQPTIADIVIAAPMHMHTEQKLPLRSHPSLQRWMTDRLESLPAWKATHVGPGFTLAD